MKELRGICSSPSATGPTPVSDQVIDEVVSELNDLARGAALDIALRIGQLIVERFYGGDLTAWRRHATKEASFRKLAARTERDLRMSPTGLYRAVALYEMVERLALPPMRHIGVTHLRLVLGLPEGQQRRLLATAEQLGWQSERLELETARIRGTLPRRAGRSAVPPLVKAIRRVARLSRDVREMSGEGDDIARLSREDLRAVHQAVEGAREDLERLQRNLRAAAGGGVPVRAQARMGSV